MVKVASADADKDAATLFERLGRNWLLICGAALLAAALAMGACLLPGAFHPAQAFAQSTSDETIDALRERLRMTENKATEYAASRTYLASRNSSAIAGQQLTDIAAELRQIKTTRVALAAKAESIRDALAANEPVELLPDILASGAMQQFAEYRLQINALIADLSTTLRQNDPRLRSLRAQRDNLSAQASVAGRMLLASIEKEITAAKERESELEGEIAALRKQLAGADDMEAQLRMLEAEASTLRRALADRLAIQRASITASDDTAPWGFRLSPQCLSLLGLGLLAGLLLLSLLVILRDVLRKPAGASASHPGEAIEEVKMPVQVEPQEIEQKPAGSPYGVDAIALRLMESGEKRVVVVSPEGDEASAATVHLVRNLADRGRRVVLLDMSAYGSLGLAMLDGYRHAGVTELLTGRKRFNEIIHSDRFSQAHVIPLGEDDPVQAMNAADRLPFILESLEAVYDFVIIECGASTARQISRVTDRTTSVIMSVVDPESAAVTSAALDLDQGGYEDVVIFMDERASKNAHTSQ